MTESLLDIRNVTVEFPGGRRKAPVRALDGVSVGVEPGETLGIVGESGSGKSTLGNAILGLVPVREGTITFDGRDITRVGRRERRDLSRHVQVVFQDPYSSLNPSRTIGQTLAEPILVHRRLSSRDVGEHVAGMLKRVGLPADTADRYPAHFSGGQRQRIAIARALMLSPKLVICDEAVSALDLSVQAQVLNLLLDLQQELALSYLFISHDLDVVRHVSHRVAVLLKGRVVEEGSVEQVTTTPTHPYTQALLAAAPVPDPDEQAERRRERANVTARSGTSATGSGCPYTDRCPSAMDVCATHRPIFGPSPHRSVAVACHLHTPEASQRATSTSPALSRRPLPWVTAAEETVS